MEVNIKILALFVLLAISGRLFADQPTSKKPGQYLPVTLSDKQLVLENQLTLTTYNAGIAHSFVPYAKERLPHVIDALSKLSDTDVLCLQEVWTKEDRARVAAGLKERFPYTHYEKDFSNIRSSSFPTCSPMDLIGKNKVVSCLVHKCRQHSGDAFSHCFINTCGGAYQSLIERNRECAVALVAQVGGNPLVGILKIMISRAQLYTYGGSSGLMLFSRHPLRNVGEIDMTDLSAVTRRKALTAEVVKGGVIHNLVCTHLGAQLPLPYPGIQGGWQGENTAQLSRILSLYPKSNKLVHLIGDFNMSPSMPDLGIKGSFTNSYRVMLERNDFANSLFSFSPSCTYCKTNPLIHNEDPDGGTVLDHIFVSGAVVKDSKLVLDQSIKIDVDGKSVTTKLSDHYGVTTKVGAD